jgi:hypothetical protein
MPMALVDYGAFELYKGLFDQAVNLGAAKTGLEHQGFTQDQIKQAVDLAFSTMTTVKGSGMLGNIGIVSAAMGVTQDAAEAMAMLPNLAQLQVNLRSIGHGGAADEMMQVVRSADFLAMMSSPNAASGKQELDLKKFENFTKMVTAADAATHGGFGPSQLLALLRAGAPSTALLDNSEVFGPELAMAIALGPSKAGVSIRAFQQQFGGGKGSEATTNMLIDLGILKGGGVVKKDNRAPGANPFTRKIGIGQSILLPGAMSPEDMKLATENPSAFVLKDILPAMENFLAKTYGKTYSAGDERTKIEYEGNLATQLAARYPAATEIIEVLRNRFAIERETAAVKVGLNRDQSAISAGNPQVNIDAFNASWKALQASFGATIMPTIITDMNALTGALNSMAAFASDNPTITSVGLDAIFVSLGGLTTMAVGGKLAALAKGLNLVGDGFTTALGPLGLLVTAAYGVGKALDYLQSELHKVFSWIPATNMDPEDYAKDYAKKHGLLPPTPGVASPWNLPGGGNSPMPAAPSDPNDPFANPSRLPGAITDPNFHHTAWNSYAPRGNFGGSSDPMPVVVMNGVRISNGRELVYGISDAQARLSARPSGGLTGSDSRIDASGAFRGNAVSV